MGNFHTFLEALYKIKNLRTEWLTGVVADSDVIDAARDATSADAEDESKRLLTVEFHLRLVPVQCHSKSAYIAIEQYQQHHVQRHQTTSLVTTHMIQQVFAYFTVVCSAALTTGCQ